MLIIFGLGISMGGIYPTAMTIAGGSIKQYPMSIGWLLVLSGIGGIMMPVVTGVLANTYGISAGMTAIIVAILIMLLGVIIYTIGEKK